MKIKTVGQLIEKLKQFDENCELDIKVCWYDRNNFNYAHRDIWDNKNNGIELCVMEEEKGIVTIENEYSKDCCLYD